MSELVDSRKSLRRELLTRRSGMDPAERVRADRALCDNLLAWIGRAPFALSATAWVAWYWPIRAEPDLRPIWNEIGRPALPVVHTAGAPLAFAAFESVEALAPDAAGVPAPIGPAIAPELVIVPCLGFFANPSRCVRLGYGGGYYDRTLPALGVPAVGVAYQWGHLTDFQAAEHDAPLTAIVTDHTSYDVAPR